MTIPRLKQKESPVFDLYMDVSVQKSVSSDADWIVEGIASTSHADLYGDVVLPEKFEKELEFFKEKGSIFFEHGYIKKDDSEARTPIGRPLDAKIVGEGLYIKLKLNKEHPISQKIWKEVFTNPDESFRNTMGLSIGAKCLGEVKKVWDSVTKKFTNYLPDLLLYEVSLTPKPVNPYTRTWASFLKSIIKEDIIMKTEKEVIHLENAEIVEKDGKQYLKSSFSDADSVDFEVLIPLSKENALKAFPEAKPEETEEPATDPAPSDAAPSAEDPMASPPVGGDTPPVADPMAEGAADPTMAGADPTTPVDAMATDPNAMGADGVSQDGNDADSALNLIHDKIETLVEMVQNLTSRMDAQNSQTAPTNNTDMTPPVMQQDNTSMFKSIVSEELSKAVEALTDVIKSASNTNSLVAKSVNTSTTSQAVRPDLVLSSILMENGEKIPMESLSADDIQDVRLKSLIDDLSEIRGHSIGAINQKAQIKSKIKQEFNLSDSAISKLIK